MLEDEDITNLASAASAQGSEFAQKDAEKENAPLAVAKNHGKNLSLTGDLIGPLDAVTLTKDVPPDHSERSFYKELVKVIEASDVVLEVLDARDPLGTRCIDMENMVRKADPSKQIVLLLNKIGIMQRFIKFRLYS